LGFLLRVLEVSFKEDGNEIKPVLRFAELLWSLRAHK
jgi:hypothetical protein